MKFLKTTGYLCLLLMVMPAWAEEPVSEELAALKERVAYLELRLQAMEQPDSGISSEVSAFKEDLSKVKQQVSQFEDRLSALEKQPDDYSQRNSGSVAYSGGSSELELPEISVIVDGQADFSDSDDDDQDGKIRIKEAEFVLSGYLNPGIRGDFIAALEQHYEGNEVETHVDLEEAYISFLELPAGLQATAGRKLISLGRMNPIHPHQWAFADTPLALENLFGDHPWFDDGVEMSALIPNPADIYLKVSGGIWNGRSLEHGHGHDEEEEDHDEDAHDEAEHEDEHDHDALIEWEDHVYSARLFADFPFTDEVNLQTGFSLVVDEGSRNTLQAADVVLKYQWPSTYRRLKWHTEFFRLEDDVTLMEPAGWFSYLQLALDKYWEFGLRYDGTELLADDSLDQKSWAAFVSYYLTHTTFVRGQYQQLENPHGEEENRFIAQFVWGIGPHSHRLDD